MYCIEFLINKQSKYIKTIPFVKRYSLKLFDFIVVFSGGQAKRDRSKIACFWENQTGGCRKAQCQFMHLKPRDENGTILSEEDLIGKASSRLF